MLSGFEPLKCGLGEECLHSQFANRQALRPARCARERGSCVDGTRAAAFGHLDDQYRPWSGLQRQVICLESSERELADAWIGAVSHRLIGRWVL